jgi:hypothetical protein
VKPRKKEGNLEFGSNQDSVGKGCQKSGCGGYSDCRVVVIYSVVNCEAEGVRRDSVVLGCKCVVTLYQTTRRHIPDDSNLRMHGSQNFKSHKLISAGL